MANLEQITMRKRVLAEIEADPDHFDIAEWHCGKKMCIGGWTDYLTCYDAGILDEIPESGKDRCIEDIRRRANLQDPATELGLSYEQSRALFFGQFVGVRRIDRREQSVA